MKIWHKGIGILLLMILIIILLGPRTEYDQVDGIIKPLDIDIDSLDNFISQKENSILNLKPDNEARIIWADSTKKKTPYSIVYLHGFSASQEEGDPVHLDFAERYGLNLFLSRLSGHGIKDSLAFEFLTPKDYVDSAEEAIAIGQLIGDSVIVMSCSTGSTLSAILAARNPGSIHSQVMYSPNIDVKDSKLDIMTYPWGYQIVKMNVGSDLLTFSYPTERISYWNDSYHIKGLISLKTLINETMTKETFKAIDQPLFLGYYYKDEINQDQVVSVPRMHDFFRQVSTPEDKKRMVAFPNAGRHVITSYMTSGDLEGVLNATFKFAEEVLNLAPIN